MAIRLCRDMLGGLALLLMISVSLPAHAENRVDARLNDFGGVGLLQTPTARFAKDGQFGVSIGRAEPLRRYTASLQALPFLETALRYTDIRSVPYSSSQEFSGDQTYKDRGFDLKLLLLKEQEYVPQLAVGLRDIGGTGIFAGEFIVASKRIGSFDLSAGAAWGVPGSKGSIRNPLTYLSDRFATRQTSDIGQLGTDFFTGPTIGLFGGMTYATPLKGLQINIEYDSTAYSETNFVPQTAKTQINVGADYAVTPWLTTAVGYERGNTLMWRTTLHTNFNTRSLLPDLAPAPVPVLPDPPIEEITAPAPVSAVPFPADTNWQDIVFTLADQRNLEILDIQLEGEQLVLSVERRGFGVASVDDYVELAERLSEELSKFKIDITAIRVHGLDLGREWVQANATINPKAQPIPENGSSALAERVSDSIIQQLTATLEQQRFILIGTALDQPTIKLFVARQHFRSPTRALGRILRSVVSVTPPQFQDIRVIFVENGLNTHEVSVLRSQFLAAALGQQTNEELAHQIQYNNVVTSSTDDKDFVSSQSFPEFSFSLLPKTKQSIGRPEQFLTYQVLLQAQGEIAVSPSLSLTAAVGQNIINNFDNLDVPSDSVVPHVRSDIAQYLKEGESSITRLQADYLFNVTPNVYGRVSAGLLEEMFGGVSSELLYKPVKSDWAFGLDINAVQQRNYDMLFGFRDYSTITGHGTVYYRPSFWRGLTFKLPVGRYLAGDIGATLDISRRFDSGITMGVFATKTDLSAEEFGEGSFDKGFYISIPLDQILPSTQRGTYGLAFRPLTRDGGQRLAQIKPLYDIVTSDSHKDFDSLADILR